MDVSHYVSIDLLIPMDLVFREAEDMYYNNSFVHNIYLLLSYSVTGK